LRLRTLPPSRIGFKHSRHRATGMSAILTDRRLKLPGTPLLYVNGAQFNGDPSRASVPEHKVIGFAQGPSGVLFHFQRLFNDRLSESTPPVRAPAASHAAIITGGRRRPRSTNRRAPYNKSGYLSLRSGQSRASPSALMRAPRGIAAHTANVVYTPDTGKNDPNGRDLKPQSVTLDSMAA